MDSSLVRLSKVAGRQSSCLRMWFLHSAKRPTAFEVGETLGEGKYRGHITLFCVYDVIRRRARNITHFTNNRHDLGRDKDFFNMTLIYIYGIRYGRFEKNSNPASITSSRSLIDLLRSFYPVGLTFPGLSRVASGRKVMASFVLNVCNSSI